jgi:hypothetical protein
MTSVNHPIKRNGTINHETFCCILVSTQNSLPKNHIFMVQFRSYFPVLLQSGSSSHSPTLGQFETRGYSALTSAPSNDPLTVKKKNILSRLLRH